MKRFFIDDGPYFNSLEHLVDYYSSCADGLPAPLSNPVSPTRLAALNHYNLIDFYCLFLILFFYFFSDIL